MQAISLARSGRPSKLRGFGQKFRRPPAKGWRPYFFAFAVAAWSRAR